MQRGYPIQKSSALSSFGMIAVSKAASVIAVGLILSGCVATTLSPPAGVSVLSSGLSLTPQGAEQPAENAGPTKTTDQTDVAVSGTVPVPVYRPGTTTPDSAKLALANTSSTSVAAQKAAKVARPEKAVNKNQPTAKSDTNANQVAVAIAPPKKKKNQGFFASLFQSSRTIRPKRNVSGKAQANNPKQNNRKVAVFRPVRKGALPGVRKLGLFGIYDAKEGADEGYDSAVRLASIGGLARTSPNGLRIQHSRVQVACLRPNLVRIIKQVQRRYGRVPIVTSGYRSPSANKRARGARNSMHIYCKAADIQVAGVSKWALAKYLRSIPGRGGVGTYCHTKSVHIDVGSKRDWNWRCRRGKKRRKRKRK